MQPEPRARQTGDDPIDEPARELELAARVALLAERAALAGDYRPLLPLLASLPVGTLFLELATPRAGELDVLRELPKAMRIGVGVVNQKHERVEPLDEIVARGRRAVELFGAERVLLTPDCGFATFADNPVASPRVAEDKLRAIAKAAAILRQG